MGEFEDLIQQAREGDTSALDRLETEFNVSTLREKASEADRYREIAEKATPVLRQNRVAELSERLSEDLRPFASAEDFSDVDPEAITLESLQDRARAKSEAEGTRKLAAAQDAGFETVEEYEEALNAVKQQREQRREGMEAVGGAASGGSEQPGSVTSGRYQVGREAFDSAKEEGRADDHAMANAVDAIMEHQLEELETE